MPETKTCRICNTDKPASEFYKKALTSDGLFHECKQCHRSLVKEKKEGVKWF